jgi:branched-subunit amino acid ABC-type transport system permease component
LFFGTWILLQFGATSYLAQLAVTLACATVGTLLMHYGIEQVFYRPVRKQPRELNPVMLTAIPAQAAGSPPRRQPPVPLDSPGKGPVN